MILWHDLDSDRDEYPIPVFQPQPLPRTSTSNQKLSSATRILHFALFTTRNTHHLAMPIQPPQPNPPRSPTRSFAVSSRTRDRQTGNERLGVPWWEEGVPDRGEDDDPVLVVRLWGVGFSKSRFLRSREEVCAMSSKWVIVSIP